jgi:hypothetical protein
MKQQTLAINASKHPTNEDKNIQNTSNGHNQSKSYKHLKIHHKITTTITTKHICLLEGANMKPIVIKLWKRHNLVINLR